MVLPVWALIDGDTPVSDGRVKVVEPGRSSPLTQVGGAPRNETTSRGGGALLQFPELPRNFTVVVSGGEVRGDRLQGDLRAEVRGYDPSGVVHVNPVTTMIAEDLEAQERGGDKASLPRATRGVEHMLGIPPHMDATDLRRSDEFFDGDTFFKEAGGGDGVAELIDELVRVELGPGDPARRFVDADGGRGPDGERMGVRAQISGDLVVKAFRWLTETAAGRLADYLHLPPEAQELLIGWVTSGWAKALGEDEEAIANPDMVEIREFFAKVDKQLTEIEADVVKTKLDVLVAMTNNTMGKIDFASEQLSLLASLPRNDATKANFAARIGAYTETNLLDAPAILHRHLGGSVPLADNVIKAASQAVAKRGRFFYDRDSAVVKGVFEYYALYQTQLATVLTNYWHTKPDTYSAEVIKAGIERINANIAEQRSLLKPTVPNGSVIDTRTNMMWTQNFPHQPVDAFAFYRRDQSTTNGPLHTVYPQATHGPREVPGLPYGNWVLPSRSDIETLIDGRGGEKAPHWLDKVAGMSQHQTDAGGGLAWMSKPSGWSSHTPTKSFEHRLEIFRYHLWEARVVETTIRWCSAVFQDCRDELRNKLQAIKGATMYVRPVGAEESYWWR